MKFAYQIQIAGEFLAIDDDGKIVNRQVIQPSAVTLAEESLEQLSVELMKLKESFFSTNGITAEAG